MDNALDVIILGPDWLTWNPVASSVSAVDSLRAHLYCYSCVSLVNITSSQRALTERIAPCAHTVLISAAKLLGLRCLKFSKAYVLQDADTSSSYREQ